MWELDLKEGWALNNWCFCTVVLDRTLESLLDCKEIQPVHPKGNQYWTFIRRTDAEAEAPILQPSDAKSWLIGKDPYAWKDWRQEEKGTTEDTMAGWHYWLNGHEFEQPLGNSEGQNSLVCCSPWDRKELGTTEWLNNNNTGPSTHLSYSKSSSYTFCLEYSTSFTSTDFLFQVYLGLQLLLKTLTMSPQPPWGCILFPIPRSPIFRCSMNTYDNAVSLPSYLFACFSLPFEDGDFYLCDPNVYVGQYLTRSR